MQSRESLLCDRDGSVWIGTPLAASRYQQGTSNTVDRQRLGGTGPGVPNPYSVKRGQSNDMEHMPARVFAPPMGPQHTFPDMDALNRLWFTGIDGGLPNFFPRGNRAAVSVHTPDGGQPQGLRMIIVSPMKFNQQWSTRRTGKDVRKQPGTVRPMRRFVPGV